MPKNKSIQAWLKKWSAYRKKSVIGQLHKCKIFSFPTAQGMCDVHSRPEKLAYRNRVVVAHAKNIPIAVALTIMRATGANAIRSLMSATIIQIVIFLIVAKRKLVAASTVIEIRFAS